MRALNRKLVRDLWGLKGQIGAIALVLAIGVGAFIGLASTLDSLHSTKQRFYAESRFADVFARLNRAPEAVSQRIESIPGVTAVQTAVVEQARLTLPGYPEPIMGEFVSIPADGEARLNRLFVTAGRRPLPDRADEVVISEAFAAEHGLEPGVTLNAILNGREQRLSVVGVGMSPEYVYQVKPGDLFPDFRHFVIVWMNRAPLATAFDMDGAFNSVALRHDATVLVQDVIERVDRILAPYGGLGAHGRELQISHRFLRDEIDGIEAMTRFAPLIFLGVAAFLLNVVVGRLVRNQRNQIAILKAFGYSNTAVGLHYLAMVAVIVAVGGLLGVGLGVWLGQEMGRLLGDFFRFPYLDYALRPNTVLIALAVTAAAVFAGTIHAVWRAVSLPPAEAMRPEPPAQYRETLLERFGLKRFLDQPTRMIARHIERQPVKSALSILGIAFAVAIVMVGRFALDSMTYAIDFHFEQAAREDMTVMFVQPTSREAIYSLSHLPGVFYAEPFRSVPVELHVEHRRFRTALQGFLAEPRLHRALDAHGVPIVMSDNGVMLTDYLGEMLGVGVGDTIEVAVLEGRRDRLQVPVAGLVHEYFGANAYMSLAGLNRLLREADAISGAYLAVDPAARDALVRALDEMPRVASVTRRELLMQNFEQLMGDVTGVFEWFIAVLAGVIAFGIVYNSARIALAERAWELASLRVLGYSKSEVAYVLVGELALLTALAIAPGFLIGTGFAHLMLRSYDSDLYRLPVVIAPSTYGVAAVTVLAAAAWSAWLIARRLNRLDMVSALKEAP